MREQSTKTCPICGTEFIRKTYFDKAGNFKGYGPDSTTCSRVCGGAWRRSKFAETFWEDVDQSGGPDACWPWLGSKDSGGYGMVRHDGKRLKAHRAAYELVIGPIPDGLDLLHRCDNPPCCNPTHCFPGTHGENMKDAYAKGRKSNTGTKNPHSSITDEQVREIRRLYTVELWSQQRIANEFGIHQTQVSRIVRGEHWGHIA